MTESYSSPIPRATTPQRRRRAAGRRLSTLRQHLNAGSRSQQRRETDRQTDDVIISDEEEKKEADAAIPPMPLRCSRHDLHYALSRPHLPLSPSPLLTSRTLFSHHRHPAVSLLDCMQANLMHSARLVRHSRPLICSSWTRACRELTPAHCCCCCCCCHLSMTGHTLRWKRKQLTGSPSQQAAAPAYTLRVSISLSLTRVSAVRPYVSACQFDRLGALLATASSSGDVRLLDMDVALTQHIIAPGRALDQRVVAHRFSIPASELQLSTCAAVTLLSAPTPIYPSLLCDVLLSATASMRCSGLQWTTTG
jgi:hypothetical protein